MNYIFLIPDLYLLFLGICALLILPIVIVSQLIEDWKERKKPGYIDWNM